MAVFRYRVRESNGRIGEGVINADSADAAALQLADGGAIPLEIEEDSRATTAAKDAGSGPLAMLLRKKITLDDLILFSRQMYSITKAGVPIIQGMSRLAESTPNPRFAAIMRDIVHDLEAGRDLAGAFGRHVDVFGTLYISLLRVGEMTGQTDTAFKSMYEYLTRDKTTIDRIKAATRYPIFVIVAISIAIGVLTVVVIPTFARVFDNVQMELPLATRLILALSSFAAAWWHMVVAAIVLAVFIFKRWVRTEAGRLIWDRFCLRIPGIGDIILRATLARFTRAFGVALKAGVPITQALAGVARASGNAYIAEKIIGMRTGIERGDSVLRTAASAAVFTPVVLQMVAVGEETGQLDTMLLEVADFYDREVEYDIANLSSVIEPILTIVVGIMVLVLALGVFLPMWDLTQLTGKR